MSKIFDIVKPGVVTGDDVTKLFNHAKENNFAIPAVNCVGTDSINAVLEAAAAVKSPVIVQFSNGGGIFIAGNGRIGISPFHDDGFSKTAGRNPRETGLFRPGIRQTEFLTVHHSRTLNGGHHRRSRGLSAACWPETGRGGNITSGCRFPLRGQRPGQGFGTEGVKILPGLKLRLQ